MAPATQIAQIQTMIDQEYDICLLIAGSATALDQVVESAHAAGVIVVNWDSLVSTDQLTAIVNTDQHKWGNMTAQWLVDAIGGGGIYRGAFQFMRSTWKSSPKSPGGAPIAHPYRTQAVVAVLLKQRQGSSPWPVCG